MNVRKILEEVSQEEEEVEEEMLGGIGRTSGGTAEKSSL